MATAKLLQPVHNHFHGYCVACLLCSIGAAIGVVVTTVILPAFGQTYLYFDRDRFEIRRELFGFRYWRKRGKTSRITEISEQETNKGGGPKGVTIEAGKRKYTTNPLATVERLWLIQEIQDWLDQRLVGIALDLEEFR